MSGAAFTWSGATDRGRFRANNEDAFLALAVDGRQMHRLSKVGRGTVDTSDFIFAVSDGMGGANSGEFASRMALDRIAELVPRAFRLGAGGLQSGFQDLLTQLFSEIHDDMRELERGYEECAGMGATLSLAWFRPQWMYYAHIGDSRIYYLPSANSPSISSFSGPKDSAAPNVSLEGQPHSGPPGDSSAAAAPTRRLRQLTHDHSHVGWLKRSGRINEREARTHPRRNALQQALGAGHQFLEPHIGALGWNPGDRFLLCTDGVVDGLWDRQLELALTSETPVEELAPHIVGEAVRESGRDNATAVVVAIGGDGGPDVGGGGTAAVS